MIFWAKYGTQTTFSFPMVKRGLVDLAVSADWTPAAADSAISKDQGSFADTTNTVAAVGGTPTRSATGWKITLTATELQAAQVDVQIVDASTKAVEDQFLTIYTYGNASAKFAGDWSDLVRLGLTALPNAAAGANGGLPTGDANAAVKVQAGSGTGQLDFTSGVLKSNLTQILGTTLTETAGQIAGGFKKFFNIAAPAATMDHLILVDTATTVTNGVTVTTNNDKTGYGLSSAAVQAIWDALTTALTTVGSIGKLLVDNINATISSRSTYAGADTAGTTTLLSRLTGTRATNLDNLDAAVSSRSSHSASDVWAVATRLLTAGTNIVLAKGVGVTGFNDLDAAGVRGAVGLAAADLDTQLDAIAALLAIVDASTDDLEGRLTNALAIVLQAHSLAVGRLVVGTGSTTTSVVFSTVNGGAPSAVDNHYNGRVIVFTSGTLTLQAVEITDYDGASGTATISAATSAPANGITAVIV